jgi:[glutamine synthetase] adenylyltransferase / [glutamine synthetase]-adenylyl-L-tyrosine phosphorylase
MNDSKLLNAIYNCDPWKDSFQKYLEEYKFVEPKKSWKNFLILSSHANFKKLFPSFFKNLIGLIKCSYNPDLALHNFERFSQTINDKNHLYTILSTSPQTLKSLIVLFSASQILTDSLISEPSYFEWINNSEKINNSRSKDEFMRAYYELVGENYLADNTPQLLRKFKKREYIRIGLRDLLGKTDFEETGRDLSCLADLSLQIAYEYADKKMKEKYGIPYYKEGDKEIKEVEFSVLGMGKLGGLELNYSSDIDLIYIYTSSNGETQEIEGCPGTITISNHEYFTKLAVLLTKTVDEITSNGNVFRVDLDLRPEGTSGQIVNSLESCEIYYQSWGRLWERQALMKARVSAGSESLGNSFFNMLEPFIYRKNIDYSAVKEITGMKEKINESMEKKNINVRNIKLGKGGIREVEFTIQTYQLIFGGRDKNIRGRNTLKALKDLSKLNYVKGLEYQQLKEAYIFLRNLENRVQISFGLQTHVLPENKFLLAVLALKMNIEGESIEELNKKLNYEFERHTQFVSNIFSALFKKEQDKEFGKNINKIRESKSINEQILKKIFYKNNKNALRFLKILRDGPKFSHPTEKSIDNFYKILSKILDECDEAPMPNSALENLVKFIEASKARESFLALFAENKKFLELLLRIFGSSNLISDILIKQPDLIDVLRDTESIYRYKNKTNLNKEVNQNLDNSKIFEDKKNILRRFKQGEELRIGIRYIIGEADIGGTLEDLSSLAEIHIENSYKIALMKLKNQYVNEKITPNNFAIIGMGKLGGSEINFKSDLDLIFVYEDSNNDSLFSGHVVSFYTKIAQLLHELTSQVTSSGYAYKIDSDLRPEGKSGLMVNSINSYEEYYKQRARTWEQQAMVRARFIAGNQKTGDNFINMVKNFTYRPKLEYESIIEITRLREKIEKELAEEATKGKNVKLGYGGLADIEFSVQILQMMHGKKNIRLRETNTVLAVSQLDALGIIDHEDSTNIKKHYLFLRNLECALRIQNCALMSHLPKEQEKLFMLSKFLKYSGENSSNVVKKFINDYEKTTKEIRIFYSKTIDNLLRTAL